MKRRILGLFSSVKRAEELLDALATFEVLPLGEIEELIHLGQKNEKVASLIDKRLRDLAYESPGLWRGWLALAAGEVGREGVLACLETLGRDEGVSKNEGHEEHDETFIDDVMMPALMRNIGLVLNEALVFAHQAESAAVRDRVYEALDGVILNGDEKGKNRLRTFALERWEVERVDGQARANAITILIMLHHLGVDIAPLIPEARGWAGADGFLTGEVNDVESVVSGKLDALNLARDVLALDWKANAKQVAARIGAKHD